MPEYFLICPYTLRLIKVDSESLESRSTSQRNNDIYFQRRIRQLAPRSTFNEIQFQCGVQRWIWQHALGINRQQYRFLTKGLTKGISGVAWRAA